MRSHARLAFILLSGTLLVGCHKDDAFGIAKVRDISDAVNSYAQFGGGVGTDGDYQTTYYGFSAHKDINGDGIDDVVIASAAADLNGRNNSGSIYVVFGPVPPGVRDLARLDRFDIRFDGAEAGDFLLWVAIGDLNSDGENDLVLSAPDAGPSGNPGAGSVYVIFGGPDIRRGVVDLADPVNYDIRFDGANSGDELGATISADDINGDGVDDLLMFAPWASPLGRSSAGTLFVKFGGTSMPSGAVDVSTVAEVQFHGAAVSDRIGAWWHTIVPGDFDGDGYRDFTISAMSDNTGRSNSGSVYVIYGGPGLTPGTKDLANPSGFNIRFDGETTGDFLGSWGTQLIDVTADGKADLVMAAHGTDFNLRSSSGSIYVVFGTSAFTGTGNVVDLSTPGAFDIRYDGEGSSDHLGDPNSQSPVSDLNGDGISDLVFGAHLNDDLGRLSSGAVYVIFGSPTLSTGTKDLAVPGNYDLKFVGAADGDTIWNTAVGDINGDGQLDLLMTGGIESNNNRPSSGSVYAVFGPLVSAGTVDLALPASYQVRFDGAANGDRLGYDVAVGDLNADGIPDVAMASYETDFNGLTNAGSVYVKFGPVPPGSIELTGTPQTYDLRFDGAFGNGTPSTVAIGDVNGDTIPDLAMGFSGGNRVYVKFGGPFIGSSAQDLADPSSHDIQYTGSGSLGGSLAIGDVNGDSQGDMLIGAPFAGGSQGSVYVVFGGAPIATGVQNLNLAGNFDIRYDGAAGGDQLSRSGSLAAGDGDGDGAGDLIMGASLADPNGRVDSGSVYVKYGGAAVPTGVISLSDPANFDLRFDGASAGDNLGRGVGTGDVDGDGTSDLILGAPWTDYNGRGDSGSVFIVSGGSGLGTGIRDMADAANYRARYDGGTAGDELGYRQMRRMADLDGDGLGDLVMQAVGESTQAVRRRHVYVVYGGAARIPFGPADLAQDANFDLRFDGARAMNWFGFAAAAGDVTGNGSADLLIGAPYGDGPVSDGGLVYVIRGPVR